MTVQVSMRDVARACDVSVYTVSCVVNGKGRIAEKTRQRVRETIREMGYDPAQNLPPTRRSETKTIGLVLPYGAGSHDGFYYRAIAGARTSLQEAKANLLILAEDEVARIAVDQFCSGSAQLECDGVIVFAPQGDWEKCITSMLAWKKPVVLIRRTMEHAGVINIVDDDRLGSTILMEHLHAQGHKTIAMIGRALSFPGAHARVNAYQDYIREHGLTDDPRLLIDIPEEGGDPGRQIADLRDQGVIVTAIFSHGDLYLPRILRSLADVGLYSPKDIALAGYNDDPIAAQLVPSITTVLVPVEEMIDKACKALLSQREEDFLQNQTITCENRLIVRESTAEKREI